MWSTALPWTELCSSGPQRLGVAVGSVAFALVLRTRLLAALIAVGMASLGLAAGLLLLLGATANQGPLILVVALRGQDC